MDDDNTIICRCEDITLAKLKESIAAGAKTLEEIKRLHRLSMGPCQGRTCLSMAKRILAEQSKSEVGRVSLPTCRPPLVPLKLGVLAEGEDKP